MIQMVRLFGVITLHAWRLVIKFKLSSLVLAVMFVSIILFGRGRFNGYYDDSYNESKGIVEHIDLSINNYNFKLVHFISDKNKNLLLTEEEDGFAIKSLSEGYYLFPFHYQKTFSAIKYIAYFGDLGSIRACLYDFNNDNKGYKRKSVLFLDNDRGGIVVNGKPVYPSSLFLESDGDDNSYHNR